MRALLLAGMWVDDRADGAIPPRFEHLPVACAAAGFRLETIHYSRIDADAWLAAPPAGILISGSRLNLGEDAEGGRFPAVLRLLAGLPRVPVLGICFGHQLLGYLDGVACEPFATYRQDNAHPVRPVAEHPLFAGLPTPCPLPENHERRLAALPAGWRLLAESEDGIEAIEHLRLPRIGVQFHPEYWPRQPGEPYGRRVIENWLGMLP